MNRYYDIIIIGAGAAGLLLASRVNLTGTDHTGLILEATSRPGSKLRMAGAGHCNFTHAGSVKEMVDCYGSRGREIRRILYRYNNDSFREHMAALGFPSYARDDGRIFPRCENGEQVRQALLTRARKNGFELKTNSAVRKISDTASNSDAHSTWQVICDDAADITYETSHLVIATGGKSYPSTGSNGHMWKVLERDLGIQIMPPRPALVPISVSDYPYGELSGLSFPNVLLSVTAPGRKIIRSRGDLLLTHRNFSGPAALNLSADADEGVMLHINYLPDIPAEEVTAKIKKSFASGKGNPANVLANLFGLPKRFCEMVIIRSCNEGSAQGFRAQHANNGKGDGKVCTITGKNSGVNREDKAARKGRGLRMYGSSTFSGNNSYDGLSPRRVSQILTDDIFTVTGEADWNIAMATRGGIDLSELDLKSMEFRKHPGLYAIGEALDVDGRTGGYNLQFAYSSASVCEEVLTGRNF